MSFKNKASETYNKLKGLNDPNINGYRQTYPSYELALNYKGFARVFPAEGLKGLVWLANKDGKGYDDNVTATNEGHGIELAAKSKGNLVLADKIWGQVGSGAGVSIGTALENEDKAFEVPFMYNPTKYEESEGINWKEWDVLKKNTLRQYIGKNAKTIKIELLADSTLGGVAGILEGRAINAIPPKRQHMTNKAGAATRILPLMRPTVAHYVNMWKALVLDDEAMNDKVVLEYFGRKLIRPPFIVLAIGSHYEYQVVLSQVDVTYEMFDNALNPIRARINLTFHGVHQEYFSVTSQQYGGSGICGFETYTKVKSGASHGKRDLRSYLRNLNYGGEITV